MDFFSKINAPPSPIISKMSETLSTLELPTINFLNFTKFEDGGEDAVESYLERKKLRQQEQYFWKMDNKTFSGFRSETRLLETSTKSNSRHKQKGNLESSKSKNLLC